MTDVALVLALAVLVVLAVAVWLAAEPGGPAT